MKKYLIISVFIMALAIVFSACNTEEENNFTESEPNDTFATADEITMSETYDASIDPVMDEDYYKVTASGDVTVTVAGEGTLEVRVHFFDENEIDFFGDDAGERGGTLTKTVSSNEYDGYFYFRVESAYGNDTGNYTVKAE